jgi:hypothetical protein
VVRIMSIHKSKGLEFPVVFVSGLSKRFNMQDANQSLIVDMESGLFAGCPGTYEEYRQGLDTDRLQVRLKEFLQRETASLRLPEEYAQAVSLPKIRHFLEQELAYRMWRAFEQGLLYRVSASP